MALSAEDKDEVKQLLKDSVAEVTGGLIKNRDEILTEKKALETKLGEFESKLSKLVSGDPPPDKPPPDKSPTDKPPVDDAKVPAWAKPLLEGVKANTEVLTDLTKWRQQSELNQRQSQLDSALESAIKESGVAEAAIPDALARAKAVFKHGDNGIEAVNDIGQQIFKNGQALTPAVWAAELKNSAPHLFAKPNGPGRPNGDVGGSGDDKPPTVPEGAGIRMEDLKNMAKYDAAAEAAAKAGLSQPILVDDQGAPIPAEV